MYWNYYELSINPFGLTPDPKFMYLSTPHNSAIEWMKMALEQHEFGLVTGEVGSGKTVISRYLIDSIKDGKYKICWIVNPSMTLVQILKEINFQLFETPPPGTKAGLIAQLQEGLADFYIKNIYPVVIIDEAQAISSFRIFEELRLISNYQTDESNLLSIILLGQPELAAKLKRKNHRAFLQRVRFTINLEALAPDELEKYLHHRLRIAGLKGKNIFSSDAVLEIHRLTKGYPRPVNHFASFAMMDAVTKDSAEINAENVKTAAKSILYLEDENS